MADDAWDSYFCAHLPPIPVDHFTNRPTEARSGEWAPGSFEAGQAPATASSAVTQDSHKHIVQLIKDLNLLITHGKARVLWSTLGPLLHLAVFLVPSETSNSRIPGERPIRPLAAVLKALKRVFHSLWVHSSPASLQLKHSGTLLDAWNSLASPPDLNQVLQQQDSDENVHEEWYHEVLSDLCYEQRPFSLLKELYPYQRNDVAAMLKAEYQLRLAPDVTYTAIQDEKGNQFWMDVEYHLARSVQDVPMPSGGILANMPGSGKTLEMLTLVAATKNRLPPVESEPTAYGRFHPHLEISVTPDNPLDADDLDEDDSESGRSSVPSLLDTCSRRIRQSIALTDDDVDLLYSPRIADYLTNTFVYFERPDPSALQDFFHNKRRRSRRTSHIAEPQSLADLPTRPIIVSRTSLVVIPAALMEQWKGEVKSSLEDAMSYGHAWSRNGRVEMRHWTAEGKLDAESRILWHELKEDDLRPNAFTARELSRFDLLLITNTLFTKQKEDSVLRDLHYQRLIFDEALFATGNNQGYELAMQLSANARWTISATPTKNLTQNHEHVHSIDRALDEALNNKRDKGDLDRLGTIAAFIKMYPFTTDRSIFPFWITHAFVHGHGYPSALAFLEQTVVRTKAQEIRSTVDLPPLQMRVETIDWGHLDRLSYNVLRAMFSANSSLAERSGPDYFFSQGNREPREDLLKNVRASHTSLQTKNLHEAACLTISNVSEKLDQTPNTLDEETRHELELALHYLREAIASPHWVDVCLNGGSCFVLQGQSDEITNIFDIHASYLRRMPSSHTNFHDGALIPVIRFTHLGTALHTLRQQERAGCSWVDGSDFDPQIADIGHRRLVEEQAPKPARLSRRPTSSGEAAASSQDQAQAESNQAPQSTSIEEDGPTSDPTSEAASGQPPRSPSRSRWRSMVQQVKMKFHKKKAVSNRMTKEKYKRAREEARRRKKIPLLPIPPDSSLRSARILGTGSAKVDFVVNQILDAPPDDSFIIFSDPDYNMTQFHEAFLYAGIKHIFCDGTLSEKVRDSFQEGKERILLVSPQHGGRGFHLTRANRIIFASPCWQKDVEAQATLRSHRIGQKRPVLVQTLVMRNSFEADILDRRNQLSRSEHGADGQKFMKSEADDEQLQFKLEHATYIDGVENEAELANFSRWSHPIDLIHDTREPYTGLEHIRPEAKGPEILANSQGDQDDQHESQGSPSPHGWNSSDPATTPAASGDDSDSSQSSPLVPETPEQEEGSPSGTKNGNSPESPRTPSRQRKPARESFSTHTDTTSPSQANGDTSSSSVPRAELSPSPPARKRQRVEPCLIG